MMQWASHCQDPWFDPELGVVSVPTKQINFILKRKEKKTCLSSKKCLPYCSFLNLSCTQPVHGISFSGPQNKIQHRTVVQRVASQLSGPQFDPMLGDHWEQAGIQYTRDGTPCYACSTCVCVGFQRLLWFPPTSQKHACRWTCYFKFPVGANECDELIQSVFLPRTRDRLRIYRDPECEPNF